MSIDSSLAIVSITENGKTLALKIKEYMSEAHIYILKNKETISTEGNFKNIFYVNEKLSILTERLFKEYKSIVFIMATGIVVRTIAPFIQSKLSDPAILVSDEKGKNIISLLSGHIGGANELTLCISELIGANPVITTATDVNNKASLDMISKKLNAHIDDFKESVKLINSMLVNNKTVGIYIDGDYSIDTRGFEILDKIDNIEAVEKLEKIIVISNKENIYGDNLVDSVNKTIDELNVNFRLSTDTLSKKIINVTPRNIVVGIGCRRNTDSEYLKQCILDLFNQNNLSVKSIKEIGSIDIKHDEKAIIDLSKYLSVPFKTISSEEISKVDDLFDKSDFVKKQVGVYSVAEPVAYILSEGNLLIKKHKYKGITISVGRI